MYIGQTQASKQSEGVQGSGASILVLTVNVARPSGLYMVHLPRAFHGIRLYGALCLAYTIRFTAKEISSSRAAAHAPEPS